MAQQEGTIINRSQSEAEAMMTPAMQTNCTSTINTAGIHAPASVGRNVVKKFSESIRQRYGIAASGNIPNCSDFTWEGRPEYEFTQDENKVTGHVKFNYASIEL